MGSKTAKRILRCDRSGCIAPAEWQIGFKCWALETENRHNGNCLRVLSGLVVCDEHRLDTKVADILDNTAKEKIANAVMGMGRALPDFSSVVLDFMPVFEHTPMSPELFARGAQ